MMDVRVGNDRRKQLLQQLFQQFSGMMQRQGQGAAPNLAPGMRPTSSTSNMFLGGGGRAAAPNFTHPDGMPKGLESQLGPGGYGSGTVWDASQGEGAPVGHRPAPVPLPTPPSVPVPGPPGTGQQPPGGGSLPVGTAPIGQQPIGVVDLPNPRPNYNGMIALGGGMFFDPSTGQVHGPGDSASGHGGL